jgi:RNA-directed DNA polymerase
VSYEQVQAAYTKVKANGGKGGVDGIELADYDCQKVANLYKLWNRMSSGSYFPSAVRTVEIPKSDGSKRLLGIPTISDRVAQQVVKDVLEGRMADIFHEDSYGYRPHKSAHDAIAQCRLRCFKQPYVIDLDIKGFFDNINYTYMMAVMSHYVREKWILLYVERWLKSPVQTVEGKLIERRQGTPQGGVISPLLANMFLHVVFDGWMRHNYPTIKWERYADDIIIPCGSETEAQNVLKAVQTRLEKVGLTTHPEKTKIVYCKTGNRKGNYPLISFDFLGYLLNRANVSTNLGYSF